MLALPAAVLLLASPAVGTGRAEPRRAADEAMARLDGGWELDLEASPETFGERAGPGRGAMRCSRGPLDAWMDCELDSELEGVGRYVLKIVLHPDREGTVGAFVTNSFGGGRHYVGSWESDSRLVFEDAWIDARRTWPHQRVSYRFRDDGAIRFDIEVSRDGLAYSPHSSGVYRRP